MYSCKKTKEGSRIDWCVCIYHNRHYENTLACTVGPSTLTIYTSMELGTMMMKTHRLSPSHTFLKADKRSKPTLSKSLVHILFAYCFKPG